MANTVELQLDPSAVQSEGERAALKLVSKAQRTILNSAKTKSPVDTGHLRQTHRPGGIRVSGGRVTTEVVATAPYAVPVHQGSRKHRIEPKNKKMLSWREGGNGPRVFASSVMHPGSKPRPWLINAAKAEGPRLGFVVQENR